MGKILNIIWIIQIIVLTLYRWVKVIILIALLYGHNDTYENALTATRIRVIADRTHSELMAGTKAMMIENAKKAMRMGCVHILYQR